MVAPDLSVDPRRRSLLGAATALVLMSAGALAAKTKPRVIHVIARKFVFVPSEIRVNAGESVTLQFTAPEVPMGFSLPDMGLRIDIIPGKATTLNLTPDKAGSFAFLCDVFCGSGHEDMSGTLIVS